ncbi:DUF6074 family protein [Mesorhizobium sp. CAU 1741]|uniref:DUF6074 family protein n=1 Tax=Mesorhizobium sp. CAU 1741 TaxID=3140366 RepID=UPI00325B6B23
MGSEIVAFPLHRRRTLVTDLARVLQSKEGQAATLFWRDTAKDLLSRLTRSGISVQSAEDQVRSLLYAVVAEIEVNTIKASG